MARKQFSLENLKDLDMGIVQEAFAVELRRIVADVKDRPTDEHARKVAINFIISPSDPHGDRVYVECEVIGTVPKRVSRPYDMVVKGESLMFEPESRDNADQLDIGGEIERKNDRRAS